MAIAALVVGIISLLLTLLLFPAVSNTINRLTAIEKKQGT